jgi:hypothetical protein
MSDLVIQRLKTLFDDFPSLPTIVTKKVFDILKKNYFGTPYSDYLADRKKQVSLLQIGKPMGSSERNLLRHSSNRKRLTGKSGTQNIVVRDISLDIDFPDVLG